MKAKAKHIIEWLVSIGLLLPDDDEQEGENVEKMLIEKLQNGALLCHLMNVLHPGIVEKVRKCF